MGAGASVDGFSELNDKHKEFLTKKYEKLVAEGSSEEDASAAVKDFRDQKILFKSAPRLYVAVDGSAPAHLAYTAALRLRRNGFNCKIEVLHVVGSEKDYLASEYKPNAIRERYETQMFIDLPEFAFKYTEVHNSEGGTKASLIKFVNGEIALNSERGALFFCGITGRKTIEGKPSILGQVSGMSLREIQCPVLVIKAVKNEGGLKYAIAVDSTKRAEEGADVALKFIRDEDSVVFLHVYDELKNDGEHDVVGANWTAFIADKSIANATFVSVPVKGLGGNIGPAIARWSEDQDVDFCVVTIKPKDHVTSIGSAVVSDTKNKTNIILVKGDGTRDPDAYESTNKDLEEDKVAEEAGL